MSKIKVFIKYPRRSPYTAWIANKLESLQRIVGGHIEPVTIEEDMVIICNEEGRLHGLPRNCKVCGIDFVGPIIFAGAEGEEFASVPMGFEDFRTMFPNLWPSSGKKEDKISLKKTAGLMAEMFGARPCQLASIHKGIARRLPLRCSWTPDMCDNRTAVECWERLLGYPTMADYKEEK